MASGGIRADRFEVADPAGCLLGGFLHGLHGAFAVLLKSLGRHRPIARTPEAAAGPGEVTAFPQRVWWRRLR